MPSAARLGDMTEHGTPLTPSTPGLGGSPNVFFGGQPAWRATIDRHLCPQSSGTVLHEGGVVVLGSSSVFINGFPAARQGDKIVETGGPNGIAAGLSTVQIGG
jgi:uncharacterized Zn-binding protein involved in type VI secretion